MRLIVATVSSWLRHRLVAARPGGRACPGRAGVAVDVGAVVVREFGHRGLQDGGARDPEAAQRELLEVVGQLAEPWQVVGPAEVRIDPLEDALDPLRADAARDADTAGLLREVLEQLGRLVHDADARADDADLRRAKVRARGAQRRVVERDAGPRRVQDAAGGTADVQALEAPTRCPAGLRDDVAEGLAEGDLVDAR